MYNRLQQLNLSRSKTCFLLGPRRTGHNLLGGRAVHYELFPLVSAEIRDTAAFGV